jgi:hypothetical protein
MKTLLLVEERDNIVKNYHRIVEPFSGFLRLMTTNTIYHALEIMVEFQVDLVIAGSTIKEEDIALLDQHLQDRPEIKLILITDESLNGSKVIKTINYGIEFIRPVDISDLWSEITTLFGIGFIGQVFGVSLPSLLQMIELDGLSCEIKISSKSENGYIYFKAGEVIDAKTKKNESEDAFYEIMSWVNPIITIGQWTGNKCRKLKKPLMTLMLESGRLVDEKKNRLKEKRRYRRFECDIKTEYESDGWNYVGRIKDIGLGGVFLETDEPFEPQHRIFITINSQSLERHAKIEGKIVNRNPNGIGLRFGTLSLNQRNLIRTVIDEIQTV